MKTRIVVVIAAWILSFAVPGSAIAGGWTPANTVTLVAGNDSNQVYLVVDPANNHINPDGCISQSFLVLEPEQAGFELIYKLALTAMAADMSVRVYVDGCSGNYPSVKQINVRK